MAAAFSRYLSSLEPRWRDADDLPLKLAWVMASAAALTLIWRYAYPPFIDAANVAYSGEVMHDLWRGGVIYGKFYALRPGAISHTVFYRLYHCLRYVFAPVACIKILSSMGVLGLPLAMRPLLRCMNRSPWLCLPAFALAFNTNLNMGYLPFVIGIPLIPIALTLLELNAIAPRRWRWALLFVVLVASLWFHFFLTAILLPLVTLWSILSLRNWSRLWFPCATLGSAIVIGLVLIPRTTTPRLHDVFQWIPYAERWDQLDRDVLQWTVDGAAALSFPWLILAFVASLVLMQRTPVEERGLRASRAGIVAMVLFGGYLLAPNYISWPEPAWGFGNRFGITLVLVLLLVPTTSAVGWQRLLQCSPWLAFTGWHLVALIAPFRAYDAATRPLTQMSSLIPVHAMILPLSESEWLKDPERYSFGGFTGFVFRHVGKWLAVETQGYQPWSFCDADYHPIQCVKRLPAPRRQSPGAITPEILGSYDYVLVQENAPNSPNALRSLPLVLDRRIGQWSLWRPQAK